MRLFCAAAVEARGGRIEVQDKRDYCLTRQKNAEQRAPHAGAVALPLSRVGERLCGRRARARAWRRRLESGGGRRIGAEEPCV